ncbi:MAG: hypothetical protein JWM41_3101 [Gemmatimonadetes bacterium]|nr:hypothetical protein [Gemmatimonadota bacterium]
MKLAAFVILTRSEATGKDLSARTAILRSLRSLRMTMPLRSLRMTMPRHSLGMTMPRYSLRMTMLLAGCAAPVAVTSAPVQAPPPQVVQALAPINALPERLGDAEYWALETAISEPGGYFQIEDNFTSNEMEVGRLYGMLRDTHVSGGVYMGVGPEQNFTYIAAIRPKLAFVVDIRRQAVMQHLMFKAMFEMAKDRADFISILFAKPRPAGIDSATPIKDVWTAFRNVKTDSAISARDYVRVVDRLTKTHAFTFTADESAKLKAVFDAFYYYGPAISTRGGPSGRGGDFAELTAYSDDASGQPRSFLSSEENYRYVKSLHEKNLIVPVSGDFAGPRAIRAIGAYLTGHNGVVSAFYVSNVEQYLFNDGKAAAFYANVATLPVDSASVFIRPYSMRRGGGGQTQSLCPIAAFIRSAEAGRVFSNNDALSCRQ